MDLTRKLCIEVLFAHPGGEAWQWGKVERRADKDDALKLAKMARNNEIESVHIPRAYSHAAIRNFLALI